MGGFNAADFLKQRSTQRLEAKMAEATRRLAPTVVPKNPEREPPLDPFHHHEIRRLGAAVGVELRWYWMETSRCFAIQRRLSADNWKSEFIVYDEDAACEGNWTPFRMPDARDYTAFCESDLGIKYGTGDLKKDAQLREKDVDDRIAAAEQKRHEDGLMAIFNRVTGGDPVRHQRYLDHVAQHTPDGCGFKEFHQVGVQLKKDAE